MHFTMISRKHLMMILLIISCSIHTIAQTNYYYKGQKIPLIINNKNVCVSIPKVCKKTSERVLANVKVLKRINDEYYDIFVIPRTDFEKLKSFDSWTERRKGCITNFML